MVSELKDGLRSCWHDWRAHLQRLQGLLARGRVRRIWLVRIRAKVLAYLVSRYEADAAGERPPLPPRAERAASSLGDEAEEKPRTILPRAVIGRVPKSSALIRALLEDIHQLSSYKNTPHNGFRGNHC